MYLSYIMLFQCFMYPGLDKKYLGKKLSSYPVNVEKFRYSDFNPSNWQEDLDQSEEESFEKELICNNQKYTCLIIKKL